MKHAEERKSEPSTMVRLVQPASLRIILQSDPAGVLEDQGFASTLVVIHVGRSSRVACRRGGHSHEGTAVHGDIDIIPSGTPSRWELREKDTALILSLSPRVLNSVAQEAGIDPCRLEIRNRFQIHDLQIEYLGWALKIEMERGYPSGRLYLDSMATALAAQLARTHSSLARHAVSRNEGMPGGTLKRLLAFIEENLGNDLSLKEIAAVAGLSVAHCGALFRCSMGVPIHQYVVRRRVEWAATLLREGRMPISQVALQTGFAHQSHLALHVRRLLGISPHELQDNVRR